MVNERRRAWLRSKADSLQARKNFLFCRNDQHQSRQNRQRQLSCSHGTWQQNTFDRETVRNGIGVRGLWGHQYTRDELLSVAVEQCHRPPQQRSSGRELIEKTFADAKALDICINEIAETRRASTMLDAIVHHDADPETDYRRFGISRRSCNSIVFMALLNTPTASRFSATSTSPVEVSKVRIPTVAPPSVSIPTFMPVGLWGGFFGILFPSWCRPALAAAVKR